jgi:hypothetical protein
MYEETNIPEVQHFKRKKKKVVVYIKYRAEVL